MWVPSAHKLKNLLLLKGEESKNYKILILYFRTIIIIENLFNFDNLMTKDYLG